ncbi:MAG: Gfo/Idh/MocA family oxidoreductase [archaeon]|nr:Gfo/Idh/MocA family oxidoreductase [archaeon]
MEPLRVALVGLGNWSAMHADALKKTQLLKLVTCYTRTQDKAKKFAKDNGCDFETSYEDVLARKDVDAVILCTPHTTHPGMAIQAANAGKHLLIEKPLANNVAECKKMISAFEDAHLVLSVCQDRRFWGPVRKMKQMITSGDVGRLILGEANYLNPSGFGITPDKWRWYKSESPGGPLAYLGVHMIDTLRFLLDPSVVEVIATLDKMGVKAEIDDIALLRLKFANGAYAFSASVFTTPRTTYMNVFGTQMNLFLVEKMGLYSQKLGSDVRDKVEYEEVDPIQKEEEDFARAVAEKRKPEVDGYEGMANIAVIEAAIKSSKERRPVLIKEVME